MTKKHAKKAFSLIEISIVIVIIGLLMIGVIGAKHMIKKARIAAAQSITRASPISAITNNKLWLETSLAEIALEGASSNGDSITNWQDNSANKTSISITSVGTGPTYSNSISGVQAIKFDDTSNSNYLQLDNAEFLNNTDYTIFIIEKRIANNSGAKNYLLGEEGSFAFGYETETSIIQSHSQTPSADNQANIENLDSYADKPRMITISHSKAEGNKIYINATLANEDTSNEAKEHLNLATLAIGKGYNGEIGEIAIFDRDIKSVERKEIEDYLSKKWKAPNNRDKAPICTGTILSTGCEASCSINITGSSTTTLSDGASQQISCDQAGYKGLTAQTYSCISGTLSPTPAASQCIDDNGCDSGYINSSGICNIANNCTGLTIEGSNTNSVNHGQTSAIPCDQVGYDGFSTGYSCNNGSFTAGTSCACDTANGYVMVGGVCVEHTFSCAIPNNIGVVETGTVDFGSGSLTCDTTKNFASGTFDYQCDVDGNITATNNLPNNRCGCNVSTMLSAFNSTTNVCDQLFPMAWLDASDTSTINTSGNLVNIWNDKAGTNHATQSDSTRKPSSGTRTIKGMNVIDFDGLRTAFLLPNITFYGKTFFIVAGLDSTAGSPQLIANGNGVGSLNNQIRVYNGTLEIASGINPWMTGSATALGSFTSNPNIAMIQGGAKIGFRVNSSTISQIGDNYNGANTFPISMMGCRRHDYVNCMDGYIAELIIFNSILSDSEANAVYDYLSDKWQ